MGRLLIKDASILPLADSTPNVLNGDIVIENGRLVSVGETVQAEASDQVIDATGKLAMPGLVNCHNHAAMTLFRGYRDDLRLMEWLQQAIWPAEAGLTENDVYWGTLVAIAEMIRSGTTTFADMYFEMEGAARAVAESGMRASLSRGIIFTDGRGGRRLDETRELYHKWNGGASDRIRMWVGPHAPYTCRPNELRETLELAAELNTPVHIHISETPEEVEMMFKEYGKSPVKYVSDLGLFEHRVLAAHCVNVSRDDLYLMRGMKGGVSHNPVSNMKLACGVAPVLAMREMGITVGLGTDGAGSATTLDLFEEMKLAAWLQKNRSGDPSAFTAYEVLRMATIEGAKVLGLDSEIGTLQPGKKADVILIDLNKPHLAPMHDIPAMVAYSANGADVDTVIIDGTPLMVGRKLLRLDEAEIMKNAQASAFRLVRQ